MDRTTAKYALVALLGGVAVVLAAATLPTATRTERSPEVAGNETDGGGFLPPPPEDSPAGTVDGSIPFLTELLTLLGVVAVLAVLWYLYYDRRGLFQIVVSVLAVVGALLLLSWLLSPEFSREAVAGPLGVGNETALGTGDDGDHVITTEPSTLLVVLVVLFGVLLVGLVAVLTRHRAASDSEQKSTADSTDAVAVGHVAGRAADRLESDEHAENEIYRAWVEMTDLFDLSQKETKTPGEFAAAAIDAGLEPDDVRELTRLFEQVRYSPTTPSESDEQRAVALFRRIESTYAEEES